MKPLVYVVHVEAGRSGELAWCEAARRAHHARASLLAIRAIPRPSWFQRRHRPQPPRSASAHRQAWRELARRAETLAGAVDVEVAVVEGDPATEVVRAASQRHADLIVLGPALVEDALFGNVAGRIIRRTRCAVLVVRETRKTDVVIGGTDLSDPTLPVVAATCAEAIERSHGRPIVAYSPEPAHAMGLRHEALSTAANAAGEVTSDALVRLQHVVQEHPLAEPMLIAGPVGPGLVTAASARNADLLVVGTRGRSGLSHLVLGNVTEHVMLCAPCSVLIVRIQRGANGPSS